MTHPHDPRPRELERETCACPECGSANFGYAMLDDLTGEYLNSCHDCGEIFGCGKFVADRHTAARNPGTRGDGDRGGRAACATGACAVLRER